MSSDLPQCVWCPGHGYATAPNCTMCGTHVEVITRCVCPGDRDHHVESCPFYGTRGMTVDPELLPVKPKSAYRPSSGRRRW